MKILLSIFILLLPALCIAQPNTGFTLSGAARDSLLQEPLAGASVVLLNLAIAKKTYRVANSSGGFAFDSLKTGKYVLVVSHAGLMPRSLSITVDRNLELGPVQLQKKNSQLDSVVVVGGNLQVTRLIDRAVVNIGNTPLSASGTANDILQKLPGVIIQDDGLLLLNGKLVDVWIDGRPSNLYGVQLKSFLTGITSNTISKVELISNPSAMFDAQSSAIINIITNKIRDYGWNGSVSAIMGYGKFARYYPSISFNYRKKKINFYGTYNHQRSKEQMVSSSDRTAFSTNGSTYLNTHETDLLLSHNNFFKLGLDLDLSKRHFLGFSTYLQVSNINDRVTNDRYIATQPKRNDSLISLYIHTINKPIAPSANLYYKTKLDTLGAELVVNLDYWSFNNEQHSDYFNTFLDRDFMPYRNDLSFKNNIEGDNDIYSVKLDFSKPVKKGKISAGGKSFFAKRNNSLLWENFESNQWQIDPVNTNHFLYDETVHAAYAGFEHRLKKITYQLVARAEQTHIEGNSLTLQKTFSRSYLKVFPSVNVQYKMGPKHQLNLSYRKSINRPQYTYLDPFVQFENQYSYFVGNSNLNPEIIHSIEVSHIYKFALFTNFSYTHAKDVFSRVFFTDTATNSLISTFDNLSASDRVGLNMSYNKSLTKKWMTSTSMVFSYSHVNTVFRTKAIKNEGFGFNIFSFNNFTLSKLYSMNCFVAYSAPYRGTIFRYRGSGFFNLGFQRQFPKLRASANILFADIFKTSRIGYRTNYGDVAYDLNRQPDSRFVNMSFIIRFGNQRVKQSENRNSGIEPEKSRMKSAN